MILCLLLDGYQQKLDECIRYFLSEYRKGVRDFIKFTQYKTDSTSRIKYPCKRCVNMVHRHIILIEEYLLPYGMDKKYTCWV